MVRLPHKLRDWLPAMLSVGCLGVTAWYATTKQGRAAEQIRRLAGLGADLSQASTRALGGVISPQAAQELQKQLDDLEQRMAESNKPGLVQAALMASARAAGLEVREVQPVTAAKGPSPKGAGLVFPAYRVLVEGSYSQIAEYLESTKRQRLPARAVAFRVAVVTNEKGQVVKQLSAEITMEAFAPPIPTAEAPGGS